MPKYPDIRKPLKEFIQGDAYNSLPATVIKIFDPTGISSWGDVANAWGDGKFDYQDILEPVGAIPVLGKLGKVGKYLGKGIKGLNELQDAKKIVDAGKHVSTSRKIRGGRLLRSDFNTKFVSPYTIQETRDAHRIIANNKVANYTQYGIRTAANTDDILDTENILVQTVQAQENKKLTLKKETENYKKELVNMFKFNPNNSSWNSNFQEYERKLDNYYKKVNELTK